VQVAAVAVAVAEEFPCTLLQVNPYHRVPLEQVVPAPDEDIPIELVCTQALPEIAAVLEVRYHWQPALPREEQEEEEPDARYLLQPGITASSRRFLFRADRGGDAQLRLTGRPFWAPGEEKGVELTPTRSLPLLTEKIMGILPRQYPAYGKVEACPDVEEPVAECIEEIHQAEHFHWTDERKTECDRWFTRRDQCRDRGHGDLARPLVITVKSHDVANLLIVLFALTLFLALDGLLTYLVVRRDRRKRRAQV